MMKSKNSRPEDVFSCSFSDSLSTSVSPSRDSSAAVNDWFQEVAPRHNDDIDGAPLDDLDGAPIDGMDMDGEPVDGEVLALASLCILLSSTPPHPLPHWTVCGLHGLIHGF